MTRTILCTLLTLMMYSCAEAQPDNKGAIAPVEASPAAPATTTATSQPSEQSIAAPVPTVEKPKEAPKPRTQARKAKRIERKAEPQAETVAVTPPAPATDIEAVVEPVTPAIEQPAAAQTPLEQGSVPATVAVSTTGTGYDAQIDSPASKITKRGRKQQVQRFLPTRRRIDREINKLKFAYKGEVMTGLTASYGTLSSDDTDIMLIFENIDATGTVASVKPFAGYFYRDNNCVGARFGFTHMSGTVNQMNIDIDQPNDIYMKVPYLDYKSNNYAFGIFHRSYAGLDPKGRFGLFAEFELSVSSGASEFAYTSGDVTKRIFSDNTQVKLSFNPGAAVYIFPNVCATLSFGLGGFQYSSVKQTDEHGNKTGSRSSSNLKFKLNLAAINIGMTIHLWDKKKQ